jgi:hypothetical protein
MKGPIKSVLHEELQNSLRLEKAYRRELRKLLQGSLVSKVVNGHTYFYLVQRKNGKVVFSYKGKVPKDMQLKYLQAKAMRAKYRNLSSRVKKQIRFLKGVLRGKEAI